MSQVKAPWTVAQVQALAKYQRAGAMHPFTCANRSNPAHLYLDGDVGILIPTVRGWICQCCDYTQDWAHDFMFDNRMLTDFEDSLNRK